MKNYVFFLILQILFQKFKQKHEIIHVFSLLTFVYLICYTYEQTNLFFFKQHIKFKKENFSILNCKKVFRHIIV